LQKLINDKKFIYFEIKINNPTYEKNDHHSRHQFICTTRDFRTAECQTGRWNESTSMDVH
jgi:hypothetical protein